MCLGNFFDYIIQLLTISFEICSDFKLENKDADEAKVLFSY